MEDQARMALMGVLVEMIDAIGVEATGAALDAVHDIALLQQQLSQIRTILASDACDQGSLAHKSIKNGM